MNSMNSNGSQKAKKRLAATGRRMLAELCKYHCEHGRYPSYTELAAVLGVSRQRVGQIAAVLRDAGLLITEARQARTARPTPEGLSAIGLQAVVPVWQQWRDMVECGLKGSEVPRV